MSYVIGPNAPPPFYMCDYYERSADPFHVSAFDSIDTDGKTVVLVGGEQIQSTGARRQGWMAIDYCENPVGFYPDGTVMDAELPDYIIKPGYFVDGRMFAYPMNDQAKTWIQELFDHHKMYANDKGVAYE